MSGIAGEMRILVTGGSGFIGTNFVAYWVSRGEEVLNFDIAAPRSREHTPYWKNVDIRDYATVQREMTSFAPSHIVSLAAQTGTNDRGRRLEDYATNFSGLENLMKAAKGTSSVESFISASTQLVCRTGYRPQSETDYCPDTLYGRSKVLGERLLHDAKSLPYSWTIVRPTGIWGPWFDVPYRNLFNMIRRGLYVHPRGVDVRQSLGFVGNTVCQLNRLLLAPAAAVHGRALYLADAPPTNMRLWADLVGKVCEAPRIREVPVWALKAAGRMGDMVKLLGWEVPPLSSSRLRNMLTSFVFDLDPLITERLPCTLEEAVRTTVDWMCTDVSER